MGKKMGGFVCDNCRIFAAEGVATMFGGWIVIGDETFCSNRCLDARTSGGQAKRPAPEPEVVIPVMSSIEEVVAGMERGIQESFSAAPHEFTGGGGEFGGAGASASFDTSTSDSSYDSGSSSCDSGSYDSGSCDSGSSGD